MSTEKRKLPPGKAIALTALTVVLFFLLLEGVLALVGIGPADLREDPFVGFAASNPLFVEERGADGKALLVTAANKHLFNPQRFPRDKEPDAYRIFCLGGSTTYGRPYDDTVSFAAWLRELLPAADPGRRWEVINAGGISYASYRVAHLMQELSRYEPDLFVIYTGHNEFLEERSYGTLRDTPAAVRSAAAVLARTRTWAAMSLLLDRAGVLPASQRDERPRLPAEADTMLEHFGPGIYERDDALRDQVLLHYRSSLQRMVDVARSAGAEVIFVTPASNLKDCSPFKSEHGENLSEADRVRADDLLARAREQAREARWEEALAAADEAVSIDPRFAEAHYRRGKALFALDRHRDARAALERARDEDVCPLRALSPLREILADVARETGTALVDFVDLVEQRFLAEHGHPIPGEELFLDHVHLTVEGNGLLARHLVRKMAELGVLPAAGQLTPEKVSAAESRIAGRLDAPMRAQAFTNLAQVIAWAGKTEDASRLALRALETGSTDPAIVAPNSSILATHFALQGDVAREREYYRMALNATPKSAELHFRIGLRCLDREPPELEAAAAHIFHASVFWPGPQRDGIHRELAGALARRQRFAAALSHLLEARQLNPRSPETESMLVRVREQLGPRARDVVTPKITLEEYPSGALHKVVQVRVDATGRAIPEGVWTEWHETGELARLVDYVGGVPDGDDVRWSPTGEVTGRARYVRGTRVSSGN